MHYFLIGCGGALGAMARVAIGALLPVSVLGMPLQILCINFLGCLSIGLFTEILALYGHASMNLRSFLVPGFLGGFTTFSAFAVEFGLLYEKGAYILAFFYAIISVVVNLAAFFAGLKIIKTLYTL